VSTLLEDVQAMLKLLEDAKDPHEFYMSADAIRALGGDPALHEQIEPGVYIVRSSR